MNSSLDAAVRLRQVRRLAQVMFVLLLAVVFVSAYVRLDAAGFGCADWPNCYGQILAGKANTHTGIARVLHRLGASAALLLAFFTAWRCLQPQPLPRVSRLATQLVVLMLFLAAVGIWSSDPHRAFVTFINILGGLGLVSLSWRLVLAAAPDASTAPADNVWLKPALALLAATMLLGSLIGAQYAAVACATVPFCGEAWGPSVQVLGLLNPVTVLNAALPLGDPGGASLHLLHRYCAVATLILLGSAAYQAYRQPTTRLAASVLMALLLVEVALGVATIASGFSLWLGIGHSVVAAALLAMTANLRAR